jgi:hypothetical protein
MLILTIAVTKVQQASKATLSQIQQLLLLDIIIKRIKIILMINRQE